MKTFILSLFFYFSLFFLTSCGYKFKASTPYDSETFFIQRPLNTTNSIGADQKLLSAIIQGFTRFDQIKLTSNPKEATYLLESIIYKIEHNPSNSPLIANPLKKQPENIPIAETLVLGLKVEFKIYQTKNPLKGINDAKLIQAQTFSHPGLIVDAKRDVGLESRNIGLVHDSRLESKIDQLMNDIVFEMNQTFFGI